MGAVVTLEAQVGVPSFSSELSAFKLRFAGRDWRRDIVDKKQRAVGQSIKELPKGIPILQVVTRLLLNLLNFHLETSRLPQSRFNEIKL